MPTDTLVEALWGSELPAAPRNAVQHHVTRLRRALGADTIRLAADGYALENALVDAGEFEELLTAARTALAPVTRAERRTPSPTRFPLARPCIAWSSSVDMGDSEAGRLDALRLDALEERFEAASRSASTPTSYLAYALRSTRARSASAYGDS